MPTPKRKKPLRHRNTKKTLIKSSLTENLHVQSLTTTLTLLDLRGSVPVPGPQDFNATRQQVTKNRDRQRGAGGSE